MKNRMTRIIKSEIKCISLYLEEQYIDSLIERRFHRLLKEMESLKDFLEREILEELENF